MEQALKLIIVKSPDAMREAMKTLQAIRAKSPIVQQRYNRVVDMALNDSQAEFTAEERAVLAAPLTGNEDEGRAFMLRVRLTEAERAELQEEANAANKNMSEYVRQKLFLSRSS